ncbi:hypothetical protein L873DRAFT_1818558 [Choiromyces venosus 120613-1]|uniref:Homeodomain-like domain-containing protein n=1 Tax=Choiromyces venosus 120613-1 TaxID=1336337 RepID=A0A3N4J3X7_9PEZI|nr:hypothetical protein L873DRAFT_1818558 [Choiromyces venosus 120613-1]
MMAPPHTRKLFEKRTIKNIAGYAIIALADFGWGYNQISMKTGVPVSTVQGIVKRYHTYGQIEDAPQSGRYTLLSQDNLEAIEQAIENNPRSFVNELTK